MSDFDLQRNIESAEVLQDYILDLNNSKSAWDKARATILTRVLLDLPFATKISMAKLIKNNWQFLAIDKVTYANPSGEQVVMVKYPASNPQAADKGIVLDTEGRIIKFKAAGKSLLHSYANWSEVNIDVDKFLELQNVISGLDKSDAEALESL